MPLWCQVNQFVESLGAADTATNVLDEVVAWAVEIGDDGSQIARSFTSGSGIDRFNAKVQAVKPSQAKCINVQADDRRDWC